MRWGDRMRAGRGVSRRLVVTSALLGLPVLPPVRAEAPPAPRQIGSWVLECPAHPGTTGCVLREHDWILPPTGGLPGAALEVQARGNRLVPVVALRGVSAQAVMGALLALQPQVALRLDAGPRTNLACGLDGAAMVCAPEGAALAAVAAALPKARTVEVQIGASAPGTNALGSGAPGAGTFPVRIATLDLQGTGEALSQYRAAGAASRSLPTEPGLDWIGLVERVLQAAGFRNGAADVMPPPAGAVGGGGK